MKTLAVAVPLSDSTLTLATTFVNEKIKVLCGEDDSFKVQLLPARFPTSIKVPVDTYLQYDSRSTYQPERDIELQTMKSSLTVACYELFGPKGFYPFLLVEDDTVTRTFTFELRFKDLPLYFVNEEFLVKVQEYLDLPRGILLLSSNSFASSASARFTELVVPSWYFTESLRDSKGLIPATYQEGKGGLFYFFSDIIFLGDDVNDNLDKVYQYIETQMNEGIFPVNTPKEILQARHCKVLPDGRWKTSLPVGDYLFSDYLVDYIVFNRVEALYMFLYVLSSAPTARFLLPEIKIQSNGSCYTCFLRTEYPPDYLRFRQAKGIAVPDLNVQVSLEQPVVGNAVSFTDMASGNKFWLWTETMADLDPLLVTHREEAPVTDLYLD